MHQKWKYVALGALIGAGVAGTLALSELIPAAIADEQPVARLMVEADEFVQAVLPDRDADLFKPEWTVDASVSTEVSESVTVRKIAGGRTSLVTIATTPSGVYSSDALASDHVRYPGIHARGGAATGVLTALSSGGWAVLKPMSAGSFAYVVRNGHGYSVITDAGSCHVIDGSMVC
jgi:hypothetical protein